MWIRDIRRPLGSLADGVIRGGLEAGVRCKVTVSIQVVLSVGKPVDVSEKERDTSTGERVTVDGTDESCVTQKDVATFGVGEHDSTAAASAGLGASPSVAAMNSNAVPTLSRRAISTRELLIRCLTVQHEVHGQPDPRSSASTRFHPHPNVIW